jgi:2,3-bisphosphoglycerate-independent phosphoglycerate mutase
MKVIFFFIDGVGLGDNTDYNPWAVLPLPNLRRLLNGQPLMSSLQAFEEGVIRFYPTDATLGVEGSPQSATGQATIWTGRNAPQAMGDHKGGYPGPKLRAWIEEDHLYQRAIQLGKTVTFANAYTPEFYEARTTRRGWISVSTLTAMSAGLRLRNLKDLQEKKAVYYDMTHIHLRQRYPDFPILRPTDAGQHLLSLSDEHDLTVYEYFLTDVAGHRQDLEMMKQIAGNVDEFLGTLVDGIGKDTVLIVSSDHGNSEDLSHKGHTRHKVPTFIIGQRACEWNGRIHDLTDIAPAILFYLQQQ